MKSENLHSESILSAANNLRWEIGENFHDTLMESIYSNASLITRRSVTFPNEKASINWERKVDKLLTSPYTGFPIMFLILGVIFWVTIQGANVPSAFIASILIDTVHPALKSFSAGIGLPFWLDGVLIDGAYLAGAWVVSVMLPPMAIFFPLFTLLEDFGYLPRVSFNMDNLYKRVGAHGKQALTMAMGFGCNAAGIIATRVIDSPRERLIAIITNNFSLCNGRWPTQILIATIFIGAAVPAYLAGIVSAAAVVFIAVLGIVFSLIVSWGLSKSVLKGEASAFSLELPPYRPPRILQALYTSLIDRTIFVLWRAVVFAVPAGVVIWLVANISIGGESIANIFINWTNPFAFILGLNGVIFLAYIIAIPANEIVIPTILMLTVANLGLAGVGAGTGVMFELNSAADTASILQAGGWTLVTGINLMLFSLLHNPCSTTIFTIYKETKSIKWTLVSTFLPILMGLVVTFFVMQIWRLFTQN
ncbi:MAG: ferrous iron transporter B [Ignavibacteriaceae bacterium]|jgi:ferrous iron transport protein B|nr:ferrous iron transporter B [Ignavibacteriaceae bacterium]MCW9066254.1 ferrous iron transporter B [Ignavibacteriaceae bacterium]